MSNDNHLTLKRLRSELAETRAELANERLAAKLARASLAHGLHRANFESDARAAEKLGDPAPHQAQGGGTPPGVWP